MLTSQNPLSMCLCLKHMSNKTARRKSFTKEKNISQEIYIKLYLLLNFVSSAKVYWSVTSKENIKFNFCRILASGGIILNDKHLPPKYYIHIDNFFIITVKDNTEVKTYHHIFVCLSKQNLQQVIYQWDFLLLLILWGCSNQALLNITVKLDQDLKSPSTFPKLDLFNKKTHQEEGFFIKPRCYWKKKIKYYSVFLFDPPQFLSNTTQISPRFWQKPDSLFYFFTACGRVGVIVFASLHLWVTKPIQSQDSVIHSQL